MVFALLFLNSPAISSALEFTRAKKGPGKMRLL
jgi:hypothetical protein